MQTAGLVLSRLTTQLYVVFLNGLILSLYVASIVSCQIRDFRTVEKIHSIPAASSVDLRARCSDDRASLTPDILANGGGCCSWNERIEGRILVSSRERIEDITSHFPLFHCIL